jgi:spore coat protein U-like protein
MQQRRPLYLKAALIDLTAGLVLALSSSSLAIAGTATGSLSISVTVESGCRIRDASLTFPNYVSGQSTPVTAEGRLVVENCTPGNLTIALDGGRSGNVNARKLRNSSGDTLSYQIYRDAALTNVAGSGNQAITGRLTSGTTRSFTIYGVIAAGQVVPPGVYSDTVTMTLEF